MDNTGNVVWDGTEHKLDKKQPLQEYVEKMQVVYHSSIEVTSGFRNEETDEIIQNTNPEQVVDHVLCPSMSTPTVTLPSKWLILATVLLVDKTQLPLKQRRSASYYYMRPITLSISLLSKTVGKKFSYT